MSGAGEDGRPAIDPRHDAIYQRGYRGGQAGPPPRPTDAAPTAAATPAGEPETGTVPATDRTEGRSAFDALAFDALAVDPDAFQDELPRSVWNPFIAILWALAVLFIVAATTLQWQAVTNSYGGFSYSGTGPLPLEMVIQQLSYSISPSVLTAGLLIVAGLLFWHAAAWRARRLAGGSAD